MVNVSNQSQHFPLSIGKTQNAIPKTETKTAGIKKDLSTLASLKSAEKDTLKLTGLSAGTGALLVGTSVFSGTVGYAMAETLGLAAFGSRAASATGVIGALAGAGVGLMMVGTAVDICDYRIMENKATVVSGGALTGAALGFAKSHSIQGAAIGALLGAGAAGVGVHLGESPF